MVILYIFLAIILLLLLLLLLPIKLKVKIDRNFTYKVSVGPVSVITDGSKKYKKSEKKKDETKGEKENYLKKLYREKGFSGAVLELFSYLKIIFSEMGNLLGSIKIRDFLCKITVSDEDAAETAISYGAISAAVYALTGFLDSATDFKYKKITVNADYSANECSFELGFTVKIMLFHLIFTALKLIIKFTKLKREV
ncbi:MAG: DUF2953 domain-containing protein [Ruminococcaceae bacterium]|nr:DUF2953 domain-containing protein [Oscillospiraceae bacterium]